MKQLFCTNWEYNIALVLGQLEKLVVEHGGTVEPDNREYLQMYHRWDEDNSEAPRFTKYAEWKYLNFKLDGFYYKIWFDDNPLFPHYFFKAPIECGNKIMKDRYATELNLDKQGISDNLLRREAEPYIPDCAALIYNQLITACSGIKFNYTKKVRVPNTYNNGWHYEKKLEENYEKLKF